MRRLTLPLLVGALLVALSHGPSRVGAQQSAPCAVTQTAGKTDRQMQLDRCGCEQASAGDKPTYRVGAAPFGRGARPRAGTRRGRVKQEPENLYNGLAVPDAKDLRSPEVVGLRARVLSAREEGWQRVGRSWRNIRRDAFVREIERRGYLNRPDQFFKEEPLRGEPEDYLRPEVYAELLEYLRKHNHRFALLEGEYRRLRRVREAQERAPTLPAFDWREQGLSVGGVMDQGNCQSCWAFAAASVYQSAWNLEQIRTGKYWDDVRASDEPYSLLDRFASVQQLLNCIGRKKGDCRVGGWHGLAFDFMVREHVPHVTDRVVEGRLSDVERIEAEGYTGKLTRCVSPFRQVGVRRGGRAVELENAGTASVRLQGGTDRKATNYDRALAWGYVNEGKPDQMPSVEQLKRALVEHGPLAVTIHGDACFSVYRGGVFNGRRAGGPNHVMVLVGWDDEKGAWLVKNSWGEEWGEGGFGWVAYGSNNVGHYAAWIQPTPATELNK